MSAIRRLLVANRGEIARRVFRTAREMAIATVAVYSDADANSPFVTDADAAVRLPGNTPAETYLRGDLIVAAAQAAGADAVHPGYGFLSENAGFAREVVAAGLTWIGPPADAIEAMGSKLGAKRLMRDAGVPTLPWSETVDGAAEVGFPLLVKASAGGGGRGMRVVREAAELAEAVEAASREAAGAFGDATVFCERYLEAPRHIEVQVFADSHGNVVSLFERECSIQRRHQKIVEEAPSPAVTTQLRESLGQAAVAAAEAVGYVGAGTVEFVMAADSSYAFLEMNTRLQVEHPVTELVTGLDLVRLQILVAQGEALPPEALSPSIDGHAIEVRLYAEDARNDFLPVTGTLREFSIAAGVRADTGVRSGDIVSPYYDAMIGKIIAHAPTRAEAAARLAAGLRASRIHGITTNRDLLVGILGEPEFLAGATDTGYLDRHDPAELGRSPLVTVTDRDAHVAAAVVALQAAHRAADPAWRRLPSGWRNNPAIPQRVVLDDTESQVAVSYRFVRGVIGSFEVDGRDVAVEVHGVAGDVVDLTVAGVRRRMQVAISTDRRIIDVDSALGSSSYTVVPRFADPSEAVTAGSLIAPMPGSVVRVLVDRGASVGKGDPLVVLEAMKMEHTVASPTDGTVSEIHVAAGQQVDAGTVLVVVDSGETET
ncbi:MAG TPA: biotin carboxylase N-terminal domain-containing protein [Mycobacteriales bacterium]|nr:biotin carboxylase N-terminal domain-containing protein [Mycobacteriales bacterium]